MGWGDIGKVVSDTIGGGKEGSKSGGGWGALIGGVLGGGASIAGSLMGGGGSSSSSGLTLPPEYELQFFQQFQQQMQQRQQDYQQISQLSDLYNQRMNTSYAAMQGTIPHADALKQMTASGVQIAQSLGLDPSEMVKQGLIQPGEHTALQQIYDIASQGTGYKDSVTENQIQEQKRSLQQDLARQGVPPSQQAIALQQFENNANLQRQQAGQQKIGALTGYLGAAQSSLGALQGQLGFAQQGIAGLAGLAGQQNTGNLQNLQAQQGLRGENNAAFESMGKFKISDYGLRSLRSGLVGPGSYQQQTGVSYNQVDPYEKFVLKQEEARGRGANIAIDRSIGGFQGSGAPQQFDIAKDPWSYYRDQNQQIAERDKQRASFWTRK